MKSVFLFVGMATLVFSNVNAATVCTAFCTSVVGINGVHAIVAVGADKKSAVSKLEKNCKADLGDLSASFSIERHDSSVRPDTYLKISCDEI